MSDPPLDPKLFHGLSIYQDVVLEGRTILRGERDCASRWRLLEGHLPNRGAVLDIGSNFGWFGLQVCARSPECVVASVEADPRSALIQRHVLASHTSRRICLLTHQAGTRLVDRFARAEQGFRAAFCLSILHWIPDHVAFIRRLGRITHKLFVELPDPRETNAGNNGIRLEIGQASEYLTANLPGHRLNLLGRTPSHVMTEYSRELWLAENPDWTAQSHSVDLDVPALVDLGLSWPDQRWWNTQWQAIVDQHSGNLPNYARLQLAADGPVLAPSDKRQLRSRNFTRLLSRIPVDRLLTPRQVWSRRSRGALTRLRAGLSRITAGLV